MSPQWNPIYGTNTTDHDQGMLNSSWPMGTTAPYSNFSISDAYNIMLNHSLSKPTIFGPTTEVILVVAYALITAAGVMCNLTVCYVLGRSNQWQMSRNVYIINLAVSDLAMSIICSPFTLVLILQRTWTLGTFLCKLIPVVQGTNILVSTATITVIAIDRYFTIVAHRACRCSSLTHKRQSIAVCIGVWILAAALTFPLAFFQTVEEVTLHGIVLWHSCVEKWPWPHLRGCYTLGVMLVQYVIPTVVLTVIHVQITRHLYLHRLSLSLKRTEREMARNRSATLTLFSVGAVFAFSWLPLHIFSLVADFSAADFNVVHLYTGFAFCHGFAMTSACSNPILYGWLNTNFRREALKLIGKKCPLLPVGATAHRNAREPVDEKMETPSPIVLNTTRQTLRSPLHLPDVKPNSGQSNLSATL